MSEFGCNATAIVDIKAHIDDNLGSHLMFALAALHRQGQEIKALREELAEYKAKDGISITKDGETPTPKPDTAPTSPTSPTPTTPLPDAENAPRRTATPPSDDIDAIKRQIRERSASSMDDLDGSSKGSGKGGKSDLDLPPSTALEIGLKMVSALPSEAQPLYSKLVNKPQLMLESLVMNQRFDCLRSLFEFIPGVFREEMFFDYARKALDFVSVNYEAQIRVGLEPIRGPVQSSSASNEPIMLTGDSSYDEEVRKRHSFPEPKPNVDLALQLLTFCDEIHTAYWTVQLCESFDGYVTGFVSGDLNQRIVEALIRMLQFGKVLFLKHPVEAHSGIIELCESFLAHLDIMLRIVQSKKPLQVQMADFSDPHKARALRDKLIEHLQFEVARDLCLRTNGSADVVTVAWALQFLRQAKYAEARQMLQHILSPAARTSGTSTSSSNTPGSHLSANVGPHRRRNSASTPMQVRSNVDTQMIVDNIVQILDPPKPVIPSSSSSSNLVTRSPSGPLSKTDMIDRRKSAHPALLRASTTSHLNAPQTGSPSQSPLGLVSDSALKPSITASATSSPLRFTVDLSGQNASSSNSSTSSDSQRAESSLSPALEECLYYLEQFGSHASLLKFCMKHTLIERAVQHIFEHQVDIDVFMDKLVVPCSDNSLLSELKTCFERVDPNLTRSRSYIIATCKYLNEQKAFKTLVSFQVFMKDHVRAALTCIRVFMDTSDAAHRVKCLELAKSYFEEALKEQTEGASLDPDPSSAPVMTSANISSYIMKIDIQMEVLKAFAPLLPKMPSIADYTLFGPPVQRTTLTSILLVHKLGLGLRVLSDTIKREDWPLIFTNAGSYAARNLTHSQMTQLNKDIVDAGADSEWSDLMLKAEVEVYGMEKKDMAAAERLAKTISHPKVRCMALIDSGKLKTAYLEAVKVSDPISLIALISARAQSDNDQSVLKLCKNFMDQHGSK